MSMDRTTRSADGTTIAYQRLGSGPAVVLVGGGLDDGTENTPLADALARDCTVYYARRGRGRSGDTPPYAVARGNRGPGRSPLRGRWQRAPLRRLLRRRPGIGGGARWRVRAAARRPRGAVRRRAGTTAQFRAYTEHLRALLAAGDRAGALALFMEVAGSSKDGHRRRAGIGDVAGPVDDHASRNGEKQ